MFASFCCDDSRVLLQSRVSLETCDLWPLLTNSLLLTVANKWKIAELLDLSVDSCSFFCIFICCLSRVQHMSRLFQRLLDLFNTCQSHHHCNHDIIGCCFDYDVLLWWIGNQAWDTIVTENLLVTTFFPSVNNRK